MKYYAVIDTNVIISGMLKKESIPGGILEFIYVGIITPLLNDEIVTEYTAVAKRNKFGFDEEHINDTIKAITEHALFLDRQATIEEFVDKKDIVFYEIVLSARTKMDAYLVTGNIKHFPIKSFVVTPKEMIDIISQGNDES